MENTMFQFIDSLNDVEIKKLLTSTFKEDMAVARLTKKEFIGVTNHVTYKGFDNIKERYLGAVPYDLSSYSFKLPLVEHKGRKLLTRLVPTETIPLQMGIPTQSIVDIVPSISDDIDSQKNYIVFSFEFLENNVRIFTYKNRFGELLFPKYQPKNRFPTTISVADSNRYFSEEYTKEISYKEFLKVLVHSSLQQKQEYDNYIFENDIQDNKNHMDIVNKIEKFNYLDNLNLSELTYPDNLKFFRNNNDGSTTIHLEYGGRNNKMFQRVKKVQNEFNGKLRTKTSYFGRDLYCLDITVLDNIIQYIEFKVESNQDKKEFSSKFNEYLNFKFAGQNAKEILIKQDFQKTITKEVFSEFIDEIPIDITKI